MVYMEKYKKYEFIENTNNKELYSLFKKPNYNICAYKNKIFG